jgi:hypothetical protein
MSTFSLQFKRIMSVLPVKRVLKEQRQPKTRAYIIMWCGLQLAGEAAPLL